VSLTEDQEEILIEFGRKLVRGLEDMPKRYQKMVDDHFWELLAETRKEKK